MDGTSSAFAMSSLYFITVVIFVPADTSSRYVSDEYPLISLATFTITPNVRRICSIFSLFVILLLDKSY